MNDNLAPVFLDNKPVNLKDPKPKLSAILSASGRPETTDVKWLQFQANTAGKSLRSEEVLDRTTDPSKPIYLTSGKAGQTGQGQTGQWSGGQSAKPNEGGAASASGRAPASGNEQRSSQPHGKTTDIQRSAQADDSGMQDDAEGGGEGSDDSGEDGKKAGQDA